MMVTIGLIMVVTSLVSIKTSTETCQVTTGYLAYNDFLSVLKVFYRLFGIFALFVIHQLVKPKQEQEANQMKALLLLKDETTLL